MENAQESRTHGLRHSARAAIAELIPHLTWRHHGIGVLQAYIRENVEPEVRLHIWHPDLVRPGILASGSIHDHRFDLESTVLVGEIEERIFVPAPTDRATTMGCEIWDVENARSAGAEKGYDGACTKQLGIHYYAVERFTHAAGSTYNLLRGVFHETRIHELTITLCTMREKRGQARLLVPAGQEPVHAFGLPIARVTQERIITDAYEALVR